MSKRVSFTTQRKSDLKKKVFTSVVSCCLAYFLIGVGGCGYQTTCPGEHVLISIGLPDDSDDFQMWFVSEIITNPEITFYVYEVLI